MGSRSLVKGLPWLSLSALLFPQGSIALRAASFSAVLQKPLPVVKPIGSFGAQSPAFSEKRFSGIRKALFMMRGGGEQPHVSATWLKENLGSVKLLDASW
jgi:hypothetical protein